MRNDPPALVPVLRSDNQARLLAQVLLHPDEEYSLTDLARHLGVPISTLHAEVKRLTTAGVLNAREVGRSRLLRANIANRLVAPLTDLLLVSFGPDVVVAEEFAGLEGIDRLLVFGSWAARFHGVEGVTPHDVDVLVVGTPSRSEVYDASDRAQARLGFPVNPTICSPARWEAGDDALIQDIQASPVVDLLAR